MPSRTGWLTVQTYAEEGMRCATLGFPDGPGMVVVVRLFVLLFVTTGGGVGVGLLVVDRVLGRLLGVGWEVDGRFVEAVVLLVDRVLGGLLGVVREVVGRFVEVVVVRVARVVTTVGLGAGVLVMAGGVFVLGVGATVLGVAPVIVARGAGGAVLGVDCV